MLGVLWGCTVVAVLAMEDLRSPGFERSPSSVAASASAAAAAVSDVGRERPPRRRRLSFSRMLARIEQVKAEEAQEAEAGGHPSAVPSDPARPPLCSPAPVAKKISRRWASRPPQWTTVLLACITRAD